MWNQMFIVPLYYKCQSIVACQASVSPSPPPGFHGAQVFGPGMVQSCSFAGASKGNAWELCTEILAGHNILLCMIDLKAHFKYVYTFFNRREEVMSWLMMWAYKSLWTILKNLLFQVHLEENSMILSL